MRRLFLLFVAFFATYYLWAQDVIFKSGDLYYTIRQMTYAPWEIAEVCTLPNPEGYSIYYNAAYHDLTEAIIPETVEHEGKTYPVTSIGYGAFHNSTRLKSVTIPSSVTMIWDEAFCRCDSLTTINIPNSVTDIGRMAFELCQSLTSLHIPEGVWQIGEGAFQGCWKLTDLTLPNSLKILGKGALSGCGFTSFTIPSGISTLSMGLFGSCMELESLFIPNNITTIESDVFVGCLGLTSIEIPNSVESLGGYAFSGCDNLETVILSEKLTVIEDGTFTNCPNIKNIYFNSTTPPSIGGSSTIDSSTPTCYIPCGTLEAYEASDWAQQVGEFVEECEAEQYTRDVTPNRYGTICLPFGSTDFSGATFYEIAYKAPFMIYFDEVTKLEAGKPYIFYAHSNKLIVTSDGSRVNNPLFDNGLYGTFDEIVAAAINILTNNYIVNNNTLCLCGEYCSLSANRAYVKLDEVSSTARALSPGRKRVSMSVQGENTTTALDNISEETESITIKEGVYDILGRKMSQPVGMGFYIIDGQKVIISQ